MHQYRSSRGGIGEWRQSSDSYVAATAKPARHYDIRSRGRNARVGVNLSAAGDSSSGSSSGTFALAASSIASLLVAGGSNVAFDLAGSSGATMTIALTSEGALVLTGSATGTVAQEGWGSAGVFALGGSAQASFVVDGTSTATFSLAGSGIGDLPIDAASSATTTLAGSATAQFEPSGGGSVDPAAVWAFMLPNGKSAQQTLVEVHAMLADLYRIHGLAAGEPLVVDKFTRTAGDIEQSISQVGDVVTVTRTS